MSGDSTFGTVSGFFDELTEDYTTTIERCFPRYREMLWALLDYLPETPVERILELGCGTGNLSVLLHERFPTAAMVMVDVSPESLDQCRARFPAGDQCQFQQEDFRQLAYQDGAFDLIVSSIAIHHLNSQEKQQLFAKLFDWLKPEGTLAYADQHAGATDELYRRHIAHWKQISREAGASEQEWQMWMRHQAEHDFHDTLPDQIQWLRSTGFTAIDCPWRYLLWTVLQARKPTPSNAGGG
ncbi:MAG: class I SAM-dependent methyltransferase [Pirellulales bacterium]|nr:class I SAM-dependent methyltransferase [Pirellulales bacterium]